MRKAFTLAEVLITLGIIGVVAAITMPTLIANYKKTVYVNQLKTAVSIFENGLKQVIVNEGCEGGDLMCTGLFPNTIDANYYNNLDNALKVVFKTIKTCKGISNDCDYPINALNNPSWNYSERKEGVGAPFSTYYATDGEYKSVLPNGMIFFLGNKRCTKTAFPDVSTKLLYRCATLVVDVNGTKSPNTVGRDIFIFAVAQDGTLYPHEGVEFEKYFSGASWEKFYTSKVNDSTMNCSTEKASTGYQCAARIIENGWNMDY